MQQQLTEERERDREELKEHVRMLLAKKETETKAHIEEELREKKRMLQESTSLFSAKVTLVYSYPGLQNIPQI